jgi:hypothetical protein
MFRSMLLSFSPVKRALPARIQRVRTG